jgi:hypothetical protein
MLWKSLWKGKCRFGFPQEDKSFDLGRKAAFEWLHKISAGRPGKLRSFLMLSLAQEKGLVLPRGKTHSDSSMIFRITV